MHRAARRCLVLSRVQHCNRSASFFTALHFSSAGRRHGAPQDLHRKERCKVNRACRLCAENWTKGLALRHTLAAVWYRMLTPVSLPVDSDRCER